MPKVGGKHYSYDKKGRAAARAASRRTGKPVKGKKRRSGGKGKGKGRGYA